MRLLEELRGETSKSAYVQALLEKERDRQTRRAIYRETVAAYTPDVCRQTLQVNDEIPVSEE